MSAVISKCGRYRYVLRRTLDSVLRWHRPMLFIMLNPSTADAVQDDPTIRRCISFAEREGATQLSVVNLFAFRSTDPALLHQADDPVGPMNDQHIADEIEKSWTTVAAWGAHPFAKKRAEEVKSKFGPFVCLGTTKNGSPKHPLYLKSSQMLLELP